MTRVVPILALLGGCQEPGNKPDQNQDPTGIAECAPGTNPYVVECTITLDSPGSAEVVLASEGSPSRTFRSEDSAIEHALVAWGLRAKTTYTWSAVGDSAEVTTGDTPFALQNADISASGELSGIDGVMVYLSCGFFAIIDGEGEIIGAVPSVAYDAFMDGMRWSQADHSFLAASDARMMGFDDSRMVELHISGKELMRLDSDDLKLSALTHDLDRWGPYTYLLGLDDNDAEGFEVWQGDVHRGTYLLKADFALEDSWVNGLSVADDGQVILSERNSNTIISVDGDPDSAGFLTVNWHAAGVTGTGLFNPDFSPVGPDLYESQHHASLYGDDLWVFDNDSRASSRAVRISMDAQSGALTETGSWSVGQVCENQGGAFPVPGGALVTCANSGDVFLFSEGDSTPLWQLNASCGGLSYSRSTRAYPVVVE